MPIKKVKENEIPPDGFSASALYETKEWKDALRIIHSGLPKGEGVQITLDRDTLARLPLKNAIRAFYMSLRRYALKSESKLEIVFRSTEDGPAIFIRQPSRVNTKK